MFRLAHISDTHLGPLPEVSGRELLSKRITGYVNFRRNRSRPGQPEIVGYLADYVNSLAPDHTAITGDLINIGLDTEIINARLWLESLGGARDHTVILGNHDAYVRGAREKAFEAWQEWVTGDDGARVTSSDDYPVVRRRGEVSIIGLNSARTSAPFLATGSFRKGQAERFQKLLEAEGRKGQCRVVLIHHPPYHGATKRHKRLIGIDRFLSAVSKAGAELVVHGHTHLATLTYIEGAGKQVPVACVPAAYQWVGGKRPPSGINLFEIIRHDSSYRIRLILHGLSGKSGNPEFVANSAIEITRSVS